MMIRRAPRRRLAALLGVLGVLLVAGCDSSAPAALPTPTTTPTPTPSPSRAASLRPMAQPTKPYPRPGMPPAPRNADELTSIGYGVEKIVWASEGVVDPKSTVACDTTNTKLVADNASLRFDCVVTAHAVRTTFAITSRTGPDHIIWRFKVARLPVNEKKVAYEASRQAFKPARVTCDIDGTQSVPLGDPNAITCWVAQTDNRSVIYNGGLDARGVITFHLVAAPKPIPTHTATATTTPSASPSSSPLSSSPLSSSPTATPSTR